MLIFRLNPFYGLSRSLLAVTITTLTVLSAQAQAMHFLQSSIGYHPQGAKFAILQDVPDGKTPDVVLYDPTRRNPKFPVLLGATVYKASKVRTFEDASQQGPGTRDVLIDFSDFQTPGNYELRVEGAADIKPQPVKISDFLYWDTLQPVARTFYFQRCGSDVEDRQLKVFHSACHLHDAVLQGKAGGQEELDVIGGWHNGSDYAKYVTATALSAARLMAMHEWNPKPFKSFRMNYPLFEPGYGDMDDLHHELKWALDWMMTMQRKDGAVYRKVSGKQWPVKTSPVDDEQTRYIYEISTQDTAAAAATWAMAARDFRKSDLGDSVKALLAAEKAWEFLEKHPSLIYPRSKDDFSGSGEFLPNKELGDQPYRLWAAAELYLSTGKEKYHQYFLAHTPELPFQSFSWMNPAIQGVTDYLLYAKNQDPAVSNALKQNLMHLASNVQEAVNSDLYGAGLTHYGESSNQEVVERAALLLSAYRLSGDTQYREAAGHSITYLFGLNPFGITYVTGVGEHAVVHPSHRWMSVSEQVIPGFLVDGPNESPVDDKTPASQGVRSYVDDFAAKSSNETRILNNASLAFLLAGLNNAYNTASTTEEKAAPKTPLDYQLAPERAKRRK